MHCRHLRKMGSVGMSRVLGLLETDLGVVGTGRFWVLQLTFCFTKPVSAPKSQFAHCASVEMLKVVQLIMSPGGEH